MPERCAADEKKKGTVEIISGRDRRLQGEGEETGPRLQRDRSGVSEMEPLPATQDALRLELRSARSLEVRHLLLPLVWSPPPSLQGATRGTTVDSRVPRRRHRHRRLYLHFRPSRRLTQRAGRP